MKEVPFADHRLMEIDLKEFDQLFGKTPYVKEGVMICRNLLNGRFNVLYEGKLERSARPKPWL